MVESLLSWLLLSASPRYSSIGGSRQPSSGHRRRLTEAGGTSKDTKRFVRKALRPLEAARGDSATSYAQTTATFVQSRDHDPLPYLEDPRKHVCRGLLTVVAQTRISVVAAVVDEE